MTNVAPKNNPAKTDAKKKDEAKPSNAKDAPKKASKPFDADEWADDDVFLSMSEPESSKAPKKNGKEERKKKERKERKTKAKKEEEEEEAKKSKEKQKDKHKDQGKKSKANGKEGGESNEEGPPGHKNEIAQPSEKDTKEENGKEVGTKEPEEQHEERKRGLRESETPGKSPREDGDQVELKIAVPAGRKSSADAEPISSGREQAKEGGGDQQERKGSSSKVEDRPKAGEKDLGDGNLSARRSPGKSPGRKDEREAEREGDREAKHQTQDSPTTEGTNFVNGSNEEETASAAHGNKNQEKVHDKKERHHDRHHHHHHHDKEKTDTNPAKETAEAEEQSTEEKEADGRANEQGKHGERLEEMVEGHHHPDEVSNKQTEQRDEPKEDEERYEQEGGGDQPSVKPTPDTQVETPQTQPVSEVLSDKEGGSEQLLPQEKTEEGGGGKEKASSLPASEPTKKVQEGASGVPRPHLLAPHSSSGEIAAVRHARRTSLVLSSPFLQLELAQQTANNNNNNNTLVTPQENKSSEGVRKKGSYVFAQWKAKEQAERKAVMPNSSGSGTPNHNISLTGGNSNLVKKRASLWEAMPDVKQESPSPSAPKTRHPSSKNLSAPSTTTTTTTTTTTATATTNTTPTPVIEGGDVGGDVPNATPQLVTVSTAAGGGSSSDDAISTKRTGSVNDLKSMWEVKTKSVSSSSSSTEPLKPKPLRGSARQDATPSSTAATSSSTQNGDK